jgi:Ca-activated chloride channel homolog
VFGERPQPLSAPQQRRADPADPHLLPISAKRPLIPASALPNAVTLPKTATDAELKMLLGSILLMLGLVMLTFNRRRTLAP